MANPQIPTALLDQIRVKRSQVSSYVSKALPRKQRLLNITIFNGTLAAVLTAAPAIGGISFSQWLAQVFGLNSPAWQVLCGAAAICSAVATVATQLLKSNNPEEHLARAQACRAKLEVLEIGLGTGQLPLEQATEEYIQCVEDAAFIC
jgi:hypothetical protein